MTLTEVQKNFRALANPQKAEVLKKFFKTGPGEYAEGDRFLGIPIPQIRSFAKTCGLSPADTPQLLRSVYHEERNLALILWVERFRKNPGDRKQIFESYLKHSAYLNNWDFVDLSAPYISGPYLEDKSRDILYKLAESRSLWERRVAIVSTLHFIRQNDLKDTFAIAKKLLNDEEDLIHKASGWMLREAAKRDLGAAEIFLKNHYAAMPRTMLRYAIERFPETKRKSYLQGKF